MIFVSYEPGLKGYQFWDAARQCFEISHDVKFEEMQFPARETLSTQLTLAPLSDQTISLSHIDDDNMGLDLVKLAQPPTRPPSPGQSTQPTATTSLQLSLSSHPLLGEHGTPPHAETALQVRHSHPIP